MGIKFVIFIFLVAIIELGKELIKAPIMDEVD